MPIVYTEEYLLEKLNELWMKHGKIQGVLIDKEPNFPTRKCYIRAFGSLENACNLIGYDGYKKHKFNIEDAQKVLDKRNGHFDLLNFNGMAKKCLVRCRECGAISEIMPDSLLRNKTNKHFGCKTCNKQDFINKLKNNNLEFIEYVENNKYKVKCLRCGNIIVGYKGHLTNQKYNCQKCESKIKQDKIFNNKEMYKKKTVDRAMFFKHLEKILEEESFMWFYCLGVLFSDGHFDNKTQRITLAMNKRDSDVIDNIANFLHCKSLRYKNLALIDFCGGYIFDNLIIKYNIDNQKTYKPCNISSIKDEQLIAFIIGFIDGDGSILKRTDNKHYKISIKLHLSWKDNLQYLSNNLYNYFNKKNIPQTSNISQPQGTYAQIVWGNKDVINGLVDFIIKNNIPVSERKWGKLIKERRVI